jgi:hypothetical protein
VPTSPSALAHVTGTFAPRIVHLDVTADALSAFSSERAPGAAAPVGQDAPAATPTAPSAVTVRVPRWLAAGGLAILGGAFSGLVVTTLAGQPGAMTGQTGTMAVTSEPLGAVVRIDDERRGRTPFVAALAAGTYRVRIGEGASAHDRLIEVAASGISSVHIEWAGPGATDAAPAPPSAGVEPVTTTLPPGMPVAQPRPAERPAPAAVRPARTPTSAPAVNTSATFRPVPTGWVSVSSPFPVSVIAEGRELGSSTDGRLALPEGTHQLLLVNEALEFQERREVSVGARRTEALNVEAPAGTLHVNARPWASIWVDGRRLGDTPIGNLALPVGEHEVVFRHPQFGEARRSVVVGARTPARISLEFEP